MATKSDPTPLNALRRLLQASSKPEEPPPLALTCALAAMAALLVNHVLVPSFATEGDPTYWAAVGRYGQFFSMVYAIAGIVALPFAIRMPSYSPAPVALSKRISGLGFTLILVFVVGRAAFLDREETTAQHVFLALGASHLLGLSVTSAALFRARSILLRGALAGAVIMVSSALTGNVLELLARADLSMAQLQFARVAHAAGESGYLIVLLCLSIALLRPPADPRAKFVRPAGLMLLGMIGAGFGLLAHEIGSGAFGLVLYHAQHVRLLLDGAPLVYGLPLCGTVAGSLAGMALKGHAARQLAMAAMLLLSAGYSPRAPGQLLLLALGLALLARVGRSMIAISGEADAEASGTTRNSPAPTAAITE